MKSDLIYIDHILQAIEKIHKFTKDLSQEDFNLNEMAQDAVIRNIEILGEATKNISENLKTIYKDIPWRAMAGMRDKLIHDYMGIDVEIVWATIKKDIPELEKLLREIKLP